MGKWLDAAGLGEQPIAVSSVSAVRSDLPAGIPQTTPLGKVAAKSKLPPENLNAEDWHSFYEERAAILEFDGGLSREQAERLAYEAAVAGMTNTMTDHPQDKCIACGSHLGASKGLPLADKAVVCDSACHHKHMGQQRERAKRQLADMGITAGQ